MLISCIMLKVHGLWEASQFYFFRFYHSWSSNSYSRDIWSWLRTFLMASVIRRSYRPAMLYYNPHIKIIHIKERVLIHKLRSGIPGAASQTSSFSYARPRRHLSCQIIISCVRGSNTAWHIWTMVAYRQTFPSSSFRFFGSLPLPSKTHPQTRGVW